MTVSRWERGLIEPTATGYVALGNLAEPDQAWYFWERAGFRREHVRHAMNRSSGSKRHGQKLSAVLDPRAVPKEDLKLVPILDARTSVSSPKGLVRKASTQMIAIPRAWCGGTSRQIVCIHCNDELMSPVIPHGALVAVNLFASGVQATQQIVLISHHEEGLRLGVLKRVRNQDVVHALHDKGGGITLGKSSGWTVVGNVCWWLVNAPKTL